jgi:membrane protease YdiL (CAAX protease family)
VRGIAAELQQFCVLFTMLLWAAIAGVIAYSVARHQRTLLDYGFSFNRGGMASLAVVAAIHAYLVITGKFVVSTDEAFHWKAIGAFMEEVAFKAVAIDIFVRLMHGIRANAFWAILASSVLWCIPHMVSTPPAQLVGGILLGGLLFGYIYHKSKSILVPAWIHSVANAGQVGGVLIALVYCVISSAHYVLRSPYNSSKLAVASKST